MKYDAVVVGSGPNGLAAAVALAREDLSVLVIEAADHLGGGTRTEELTIPGFRHDLCSALYPLGIGSPFLRTLPLDRYGLRWIQHDVAFAHPVTPERAGIVYRSFDRTVEDLGADGPGYRDLIGPLVEEWPLIEDQVLGRLISVPRHPVAFSRFGLRAMRSAEGLIRSSLSTEAGRALLAGSAAHSFLPLSHPFTGAFALLYPVLAHRWGWPVAAGGSQAIPDALAGYLADLGGEIRTGWRVTSLDELPPSRVVLLDVVPRTLDAIAGDRLPGWYRWRLRRFRHGPAAFKVDYALDGPIPWTNPALAAAGTVHIGGRMEEVAASEKATYRGWITSRPFVLVAQPSAVDPSRAPEGSHAVWTYAHVPNGSDVDFTAVIESQIERLAPGFGQRIMARSVIRPTDWPKWNENLVGGDISGGAHSFPQLLFRPFPQIDPYSTPIENVFLCSSSTPPGAGVHGMCGYHAARSALRRLARSDPGSS